MKENSISTIQLDHKDLDFLTRLNIRLSTDYSYPQNILTALKIIGRHLNSDRIHIIEIHHNMSFSVLYEWCNHYIDSCKEKIKHQKLIVDKNLEEQLYEYNYITIHKTNQQLNARMKVLCQEHSIESAILFPLFESGSQFAFINFTQCHDHREWNPTEIKLMMSLSSLIAANIDRNKKICRLIRKLEEMKKFRETTELYHLRLQTLHGNWLPAWQKIKTDLHPHLPEEQRTAIEQIDRHFVNFDKICRSIFVK